MTERWIVEEVANAIADHIGHGTGESAALAVLAALERVGLAIVKAVEDRPAFAAGPRKTTDEQVRAAVRMIRSARSAREALGED